MAYDYYIISVRQNDAPYILAGVKLGRPQGRGKSKLDEHVDDIIRLIELKVPKTIIAKQYHTSLSNLYNFLERLKEVS